MGFEPTIRALERAKTVHALDCTATVIGIKATTFLKLALVRISVVRRTGHEGEPTLLWL
jgi:hypothetical protein